MTSPLGKRHLWKPWDEQVSKGLFRLVYCSSNTVTNDQGDPAAEVADILTTSRVKARDGVTGALLYSDGWFAQVLEGELDAVQRTFERIQRDPRHGDVVVLEAKRVETRMFGLWDMALAEAADPSKAKSLLSRALVEPDDDAGTTVAALLDGLLRRESDWARAAA